MLHIPRYKRLADLETRLATLNEEARSAASEDEQEAAKAKAKRVEEELEAWRSNFAWSIYRKGLLTRELTEAAKPLVIRAYREGEKPRRTKIEILTDLARRGHALVDRFLR